MPHHQGLIHFECLIARFLQMSGGEYETNNLVLASHITKQMPPLPFRHGMRVLTAKI